MPSHKLKIKLHYPGMPEPKRGHPTDSGIDLSLIKILPKRDNLIFFDTGISIEPPEGYYGELFPRSSIYKSDFIMSNSVGIIDESYRGILYLPMRYVGEGNAVHEAGKLVGTRVAQLILRELRLFDFEIVTETTQTRRGEGGFGSTGK
ncbi:MAG: dUTP pyrophosphatase [Deltaproteobacteria bacterium]|nr:dUTP pyrophosphatase [Deltaproteobacteria bacterium]